MTTVPNAPRPIVVNATPQREQLEALFRQALILAAGFALGVWVAKDTNLVPRVAAILHPVIGALSGFAGLASVIFGQLKTRIMSQVSARLADMLPDDKAKTKPSPILPIAKPAPLPSAPLPRSIPPAQLVVHAGGVQEVVRSRRPVPAFLIRYLERVEGQRLVAYQDSRGRWTIGVGHTGPDVGPGVVWTQAMVDAALTRDLATAVASLEQAIGRAAVWSLTVNEYAALLSLVFNVGEVSTWHVFADIRAGDLADVPAEMKRFVYSDGVKIVGLVDRRADDVALWNGQAPEARLAA